MDSLSAVVITLNEERNIGRCLSSLAGIADEIVVVDSGSTDRTAAICAEQGARFFVEAWRGYAETKNLALSRASHAYALSIDADEALSPLLRDSLLAAKTAGLQGCYSMNRLTNYCGRWIRHGGWYPDRKVRLFDRRRGRWTGELVHEQLDLDAGQSETVLVGDLLHYSYYSRREHRERADKYSRLTALKLHRQGKRSYPGRPCLSALGRFFGMYLLKGGFRDGAAGLTIAGISAQSNFVKYRELARLDREADDAGADRILVSRSDSIGDVVLTLPLVGLLRDRFPRAQLMFLGSAYTLPVIACCRHVDRAVAWDSWPAGEAAAALKSLDAECILHVFPRRELARAARRAGIPLRIGSARRVYHWTTCNVRPRFSRRRSELHEAQLNLKLLAPLGIDRDYGLDELPAYYGFANPYPLPEKLGQLLRSDRLNLVLHPGSRGSAAEWGIENFKELIELLPAERVEIFLTGTAAEGAGAADLSGQGWKNVHALFGELSLESLVALLAAADGIVAASTGPLHIAAALGRHTLGLYSSHRPIDPGRWAPLGVKAEWLTARDESPAAELATPGADIRRIRPELVVERLMSWRRVGRG